MQGFRKGHVPQAEIDKRVSDTEVAMRALESLQNKLVEELFKTKEFQESDCLDSISNLKVIKFAPTPVIDVSVELVPKVSDFSTKDIKDITIPAFVEPTIKDEMVKQRIRMMIRQDAMVSIKKDGTVAKGDIAVIDFKGFVDNKPFKGGEGKNYELEIGSKSFIDNFEDQLIGCKKGDKKDVNVTFPKEYGSKELAGKPAKFEVVIKEVKQIEYPKITKDYCKKFMVDCANMQELEAHVKDLFRQEAVMKHQDTSLRIINEAISKKAKLNYFPKSLIEMHKNQILQQ
ncbi:MAG: trigger factor [Mycoplasmoidaceae bacterium]|nr:trigger factor [Mycoplasmoidaceae bacterium]